MTKSQKQCVHEKATVRIDKLIIVVEWLCKNHKTWKTVDTTALRKQLENVEPAVVDISEEVECENANVEEQEVFTCYHTDVAATEVTGRFKGHGAFKKFVEKMKVQNFNVEFKANLEKKFVKESDSDQLYYSFPTVFAGWMKYGRSMMGHLRLTRLLMSACHTYRSSHNLVFRFQCSNSYP
jgi:hypothetical protein